MPKGDVEFQSYGTTCRGFFQTPEDADPPYPTVVLGGGWTYVKEIVLPDYADAITDRGVACLGFDYRNFGDSDVYEQEQHLSAWGQIEDYMAALTYAEGRDDVDEHRLGVFGISYSGGHALILSGIEPRAKAVVSVVPVVDGYDNMKRMHTQDRFYDLMESVVEDRRNRVDGHSERMPFGKDPDIDWEEADPLECGVWPLEIIHETFMNYKESSAPNHKHWNTVWSLDQLLQYNVMPYCKRNYDTPIKMVITEKGESCPVDHQLEAFNELQTPEKELSVVPADHHSIYYDKSLLEVASAEAADFFSQELIEKIPTAD
jgi:cephalosporin-C deacetylase-like acetyl esterase